MKVKTKLGLLSGCAAAAVFLTACAGVAKPSTQLATYLQQYPSLAELNIQRQENWWQLFADQQLNTLVDLALERNTDLAVAAVKVNLALYEAGKLSAEFVPTFSLTASAEKKRADIKHSAPTTTSYGLSGGVTTYELDLWRKLAHSSSAANWRYLATAEDKYAVKLTTVNKVVEAYYQLAYWQQKIVLNRQMLQHLEKIAAIVRARYAAGKIASYDKILTEKQLLTQQTALLTAQTEYDNQLRLLKNLLNMPPQQPLTVKLPDLQQVKIPPVDESVSLAVLQYRPDLKAKLFEFQATFKQVQAANVSWLPTVSLSAVVNAAAATVGGVLSAPGATAGLGIGLPLLDWQQVRYDIKVSRANYERARLEFNQALTEALNELTAALLNYRDLVTAGDFYQQQYNLARKAVAYQQARYSEGVGQLTDLLEALNNQESDLQALLTHNLNLIMQTNNIFHIMAGSYRQEGQN